MHKVKILIILLVIAAIFSPAIFCQDEPIPPVNIDKKADPGPAARQADGGGDGSEPPVEQSPEEAPAPQAAATVPVAKPKKMEMDVNFDGKVDRIEVYDSEGRISRLDIDTNGDGNFDEWMVFDKGDPKMKGKDRNEDGKTDTWIEY